jgi:hypothetical protein
MAKVQNPTTTTLGYALFATRRLQAPLYFGPVRPGDDGPLAHHAEIVRLDGDSYRTRPTTSAWAD